MVDLMLKLTPEQQEAEMISSFPSIKRTVFHCMGAENIWMQRLSLAENPVWIGDNLEMPFQEGCKTWLESGESMIQFVEKQYDDSALTHVFQFYDRKKKSHKMPVYQVLHHACNHNTYHRGQLVSMLRQLGETKIPATDFSIYVMK